MTGPTRALGAGLTVVGVGAFAHAAAGGDLPVLPTVAALGLATVLAAAVRRWTFWRLLLATAAAQPVLHLAFGSSGGHAHGHHADAAHHGGHAAPVIGMPWAHVLATLVTAVALRWGLRWLRVLPGVARALLVPRRRAHLPVLAQSRWVPAVAALAPQPAPVRVPTTRGPPR